MRARTRGALGAEGRPVQTAPGLRGPICRGQAGWGWVSGDPACCAVLLGKHLSPELPPEPQPRGRRRLRLPDWHARVTTLWRVTELG